MTKAILALAVVLSSTVWAAPSEYFVAVLGSSTLKKVMTAEGTSQIKGIENTMTYRCLGCFDFAVTLQSSDNNVITLATRLGANGKIEVHLK